MNRIVLIEDHDEAIKAWRKNNIKGLDLVHIDGHMDFGFYQANPIEQVFKEAKSIDELKEFGVNIIGSVKGQGSVNRGIDYVQSQRISMTKRSLNLIKEYRNYLWQTDKDGVILKIADKGFDHTMDAVRYGMESLKEPVQPLTITGYTTGLGNAQIPVYSFEG